MQRGCGNAASLPRPAVPAPPLRVIPAVAGTARYIGSSNSNTSLVAPVPKSREEARQRENDYIFYGSMHGFMLGTFCFVGIYLAYDSFAEIAAVCVTLASATAIAGRNYGSPRMVSIFAVMLVGPIAAALILRFDVPHVVLGLLIIPFMFVLKGSADHVRNVLFSAVVGHKQARQLAQRFDRALNTMSHGLVMLGPDGKVIVANAEAAHLMSLRSPDMLLGRSIHSLLMRGVAGGMLMTKDCRYVEAQLTRALREGRVSTAVMQFDPGTMSGRTASGRVYRLQGPVGFHPDAMYVRSTWLGLSGLSADDITVVEDPGAETARPTGP